MGIITAGVEKIDQSIKTALLIVIRGYGLFVSPWFGARCRFYPTCSSYARQALQRFSTPYALWLIAKRLIKCQPCCKGGVDLVPLPHSKTKKCVQHTQTKRGNH